MNGLNNDENINAIDGDDLITGLGGYDEINEELGKDTAIYRGNFDYYIIKRNFTFRDEQTLGNTEIEIKDNRRTSNDGIDILKNIEYLQFTNQTVEASKVDIVKTFTGIFSDYKFYKKSNRVYEIKTDSGYDDIAGLPILIFTGEAATSSCREVSVIADIKGTFDQVTALNTDDAKMIRLYNVVFKRLLDSGGLKYWIGKYTSRENDERAVASSFLISKEFKELYGEIVSDTAYVNNL